MENHTVGGSDPLNVAPTASASDECNTDTNRRNGGAEMDRQHGQFQVRDTLVKVADGNVTLRKADDSEVVVPLSRLSAEDRDFLKQRE
jgi:hypothetical protein